MMQGEPFFQQAPSDIFIVQPPVKAIPVPVLHDPTQSTAVLAQLKAGTAVRVVGQTSLWLEIELTGGQRGFIQAAYARPATPEEAMAAQMADASGARSRRSAPILSTRAGLVRPRRRGNFGCAYAAFGLSIPACALGVILFSLERQECTYPAGTCVTLDHPLAPVSYVLVFVGFAALLFAVVAWLVAVVQTYRGQRR